MKCQEHRNHKKTLSLSPRKFVYHCAFNHSIAQNIFFNKGYFYSRSFQKYSRTSVRNTRAFQGYPTIFQFSRTFQGHHSFSMTFQGPCEPCTVNETCRREKFCCAEIFTNILHVTQGNLLRDLLVVWLRHVWMVCHRDRPQQQGPLDWVGTWTCVTWVPYSFMYWSAKRGETSNVSRILTNLNLASVVQSAGCYKFIPISKRATFEKQLVLGQQELTFLENRQALAV